MVQDLKGRSIEDTPYSGLIESLSKITLICRIAGKAKSDLTNEDFMSLLSQIGEIGTEAMAFAGATREEIKQVTEQLLSGMSSGRELKN